MRKPRILCLKTGILLVAILSLVLLANCCPQEKVKPVVEQPPPPPPPPPVVEKPTPPPEEKPTPPPPPPPQVREVVLQPIYFDYNKSDIRPQDRRILDSNAQMLRQDPTATIRIEGNCDEQGDSLYNQRLGQSRADAAKAYLMSLGISEDRIVATTSNGKDKPKYPGHDEAAWARNRRVDFILVTH
jgi:peptidoglycan-associated lipoprotein